MPTLSMPTLPGTDIWPGRLGVNAAVRLVQVRPGSYIPIHGSAPKLLPVIEEGMS